MRREMHNIAIVGSRDSRNWGLVSKIIEDESKKGMLDTIYTGDCKTGIDFIVKSIYREEYYDSGIDFKEYVADWDKFGLKAGPIRNGWIMNQLDVDNDMVYAIRIKGQENKGTESAIKEALKRRIRVHIINSEI